MKLLKKKQNQINFSNIPRHIAIIMDGNGRWAEKRALPRRAGHAAGVETFRRVATYCKDIGIEWLTVYAFSTENWKRSPDEVAAIMELIEKYLYEAIEKMERDRVKMKFLGDISALSSKLQALIAETEELSKKFDGVQVNVCLNYGSRAEILQAVERYAHEHMNRIMMQGNNPHQSPQCVAGQGDVQTDVSDGQLNPAEELTEAEFTKHLYTAGIPDPDLIIRPSGEIRQSNFLLWQSAYSEFYFTDTLWPDFNERELNKAILEYQSRERRYGGRTIHNS